SGTGQNFPFRLHHICLALLQFGGGTIGIGLAALTRTRVVRSDSRDFPRFVLSLDGDSSSALGAKQFEVGGCHAQQHVVSNGETGKLTLPHNLSSRERRENALGKVHVPDDARNVHGTASYRGGPQPQ